MSGSASYEANSDGQTMDASDPPATDIECRPIDISVVMPCLNEENSVGVCVAKAWEGIRGTGLVGEVIVSDNGSTDDSVAVATQAGARVVHQERRGYGNAYLKGFAAAQGRIIVMGDSDDSYDFTAIPALIKPFEAGCDYVLGSRFGGQIQRGAMTWSHRYIGNPVLTTVLNVLFKLKVSDAHSGLRAFTKEALDRMDLRCEGMEFASEIVVKATRANLEVVEIPIVYNPRIGDSKLHSLRDGWRHLRFLLLLSPGYLFMGPGVALLVAGLLAQMLLLALPGGSVALGAKILLALVTLAGSQLLTLGVFAKTYAKTVGLDEKSPISDWVEEEFTLEHGLLGGTALVIVGFILTIWQFIAGWGSVGDGGRSSSLAILGLLSLSLGVIGWFDAFFLYIFQIKHHVPQRPIPLTVEVHSLETAVEPLPLTQAV